MLVKIYVDVSEENRTDGVGEMGKLSLSSVQVTHFIIIK